MQPIKFQGSNANFQKPESFNEDQCGELPVTIGVNAELKCRTFTSCWELSPEEIAEVVKTGRIWLTVLGGQPPVILQVSTPEDVIASIDYIKANEN